MLPSIVTAGVGNNVHDLRYTNYDSYGNIREQTNNAVWATLTKKQLELVSPTIVFIDYNCRLGHCNYKHYKNIVFLHFL